MDAQDIYSYINPSLDYNNHSCGVNDEILYYVAILEASFYQVETCMWIIFKLFIWPTIIRPLIPSFFQHKLVQTKNFQKYNEKCQI